MFKKFFKALHFAEKWLLICLLFFSVVTAFMQVFFRFVLRAPLSWSEELTRYLFVWMGMIGACVALQSDSHFRMDILVLLVSERVRRILAIFWDICVFILCCIMVYCGIGILKNSLHQMSSALRISMAIPYSSIPLSGILMILGLIEKYFVRKEGPK